MAGVLEFLAAPFFHKPVSPDPLQTHWVVGIVYKLHTMTGTFLFLCRYVFAENSKLFFQYILKVFLHSCFIFARELLNDHIHCIRDGADETGSLISQSAFDSYCYISDTFTLPRVVTDGKDDSLAHPGVGPIGVDHRKELLYHNYYMWIPYLLLLQSATFFLPLLLHKFLQEGMYAELTASKIVTANANSSL